MRNRAYSATHVNQVNVQELIKGRDGQAVWIGTDVGKYELKMVVHWGERQFERPWNVPNPFGIPQVMDLLKELKAGRSLVLAMEPSGTYGDALRQAAADAGLVVQRIHPKAAHDYAEVFDGAPSQHDGKDAAVLAELARVGKGAAWAYATGDRTRQQLEYWVDRMDVHRRLLSVWSGRLEGALARHWPEVGQVLKVNSPTLLKVLIEHGTPGALGADPQAEAKLRRWSRWLLSDATIAKVIESARGTVGVRMGELDIRRLRDNAQEAQSARREISLCKRRLAQAAAGQVSIAAMGQVVGLATACVLWVYLGEARDYHCGEAYVKAMGLNLVERSSGTYRGRLKISKRGYGMVRYWMWLAAMRWVKDGGVRRWYEAKKKRDGGYGGRALVGVMRRLGMALWPVGCGEVFEAWRMFPGLSRGQKKGR